MAGEQTFTLLINSKEDKSKAQRRQLLVTLPLVIIGLVGVLCLISGASWKSQGATELSALYLGSGEENIDGGAIKAAEKVDVGAVNTAMPLPNAIHNPDGEEFKQAIAEQDSEMDTEKDFLKGKATDPKKKRGSKTSTKQQTLKQSVTAHAKSTKSAKAAKTP
mmetsp:Transcript_22051/g.42842  ORF Transcript_22051/g.42842 Transcript_22051/m.42842 type:complete len:163 (+) Transcript_22051:37-525(+)|eukprot:CAMPEP_0173391252 /NCGR_PEP_ID=MMETSP1356-20130122/17952_1 /TAXON_ID=77927 ORGANISM="Hemiselmis virescens, Strain PCC157" /NCGR_SAMPLE_ID=MMETSP1356 /ASSEMBLY_ACC=CAM_ASM_000847 /LENGTH=162 /DNA_ID=CAMNT_0014348833 /DNA_START=18 /DNA_END=506 /DNA_ORIENTATION=+